MIYKLVSEDDLESLENSINALLADGWQLYGSTQVCAVALEGELSVHYFQPMTKG